MQKTTTPSESQSEREYHEQQEPSVAVLYPGGIHGSLAKVWPRRSRDPHHARSGTRFTQDVLAPRTCCFAGTRGARQGR